MTTSTMVPKWKNPGLDYCRTCDFSIHTYIHFDDIAKSFLTYLTKRKQSPSQNLYTYMQYIYICMDMQV